MELFVEIPLEIPLKKKRGTFSGNSTESSTETKPSNFSWTKPWNFQWKQCSSGLKQRTSAEVEGSSSDLIVFLLIDIL